MKKIFVIATALLMCCMVMGCGVKAKLDGTWKSSITREYSGEYYKDVIKTDITLNIDKDGNFSQSFISTTSYVPLEVGFPTKEPSKYTRKESGTWYYHDSDKVILKTTNSSVQEGDEDPEVDTNVGYMSAELVLVDDILFVDFGGRIYEFTKAE